MSMIRSIFVMALTVIAISNVKAQPAAANTAINNIITAYLDVKSALVADDGTTTAAKAKILNDQITAVKPADLPAKQQATWKSYFDKLNFDSRHISETTKLDHQREHFASLSKNMYAVLKAIPVNTSDIYWQYCPMKKSAWLNDKAAIENPYYGHEMPDCGSVKETLKAAK